MCTNKCLSNIRNCYILSALSPIYSRQSSELQRWNFHRLKLNSPKLQETMKGWFTSLNLQCLWLFKVMHIYKSESPEVMKKPCIYLVTVILQWMPICSQRGSCTTIPRTYLHFNWIAAVMENWHITSIYLYVISLVRYKKWLFILGKECKGKKRCRILNVWFQLS